MLRKIITNFVYNKAFKETKLIDLKKYYKGDLKYSIKFAFLFMTSSTLLLALTKIFINNNPAAIIFFSLFIVGLFLTTIGVLIALCNLMGLLNVKREMINISEKNLDLRYVASNNKTFFKFFNSDFISTESNKVLYEKLKSEDLQFLMEEFRNSGIDEKNIKEILKLRISNKDNLDITLEDFCFLVKETEERINNEDKISKVESMLNNILDIPKGKKIKEKEFEKA